MKLILYVLGLVFTSLIVWASLSKSLLVSGAFLTTDPWGIVTLADLYLGFILFSILFFYFSKTKFKALLWTFSLMILGNIISVIFVLLNYDIIKERLRG